MNAKLLFCTFLISSSAMATEGHMAIESIAKLYEKKSGKCSEYVDVMKWYNYESSGLVSFAITDLSNKRPLDQYFLVANINASSLQPLGEGEFRVLTNQPVPLKSEFEYLNDGGLALYLHHKGKGSLGGLLGGNRPYPKKNYKLSMVFTNKNESGVYEDLKLTYQDFKGFRPRKKVTCTYLMK